MLVDDHALVRLGFRLLFDTTPDIRIAGEADTGEQALAMYAEHQPDVVVMDLNMPGMSGLDIAREVARVRPGLPVLLTSGFVTAELQKSAATLGVRRVLHKPDLPNLLAQAVSETLLRPATPPR